MRRPSSVWSSLPLLACLAVGAALAPTGGAVAAPATGPGLRVLQHQALQDLVTDPAGRPRAFEAYGRRFELDLTRNERLQYPAAREPGVEPLRGTLRGVAGSWVRVTRTPAGLIGMFSDGRDVYVIEPATELAATAVTPLEARGTAPVIYRLADAVVPVGSTSCGTVTLADIARGGSTAQAQFEAVAGELQTAAATVPTTKQMEVAVVADFEFSGLAFAGGLTPEQVITARMNIVDGIFSTQVGVRLLVTSVTVFRTASDPFTDTTVPNTLLDEFANWRQITPTQTARGLSHLMTGRDLDGTTVGVAFIGALCRTRFGAGLSQGTLTTGTAALVIAHEMGHNFGAVHDGETGSVCAATPQTFLMAPRINNSNEFSQCSLDSITPVVDAAACVVPLRLADADFDLPASARRLRGAAFDYAFSVRSIGTDQVDGITVTATAPAGTTLNSASVTGGSACTVSGATATCSVGSLAASTSRGITLNLTAQQSGTATVNVSLASTNDGAASNNTGSVAIGIDPSADLNVTLSASPATFTTGGTSTVTATLRHAGGDPVTDARLTFSVPAELTVTAVAANTLGCSLVSGAVSCTPVALSSGNSSSVAVTVSGSTTGSRQVTASVSATLGDPVTSDNNAQATLQVQAPGSNPSGGQSGGGGGGRLGVPELAALLLLLAGSLAARTSLRTRRALIAARTRRAR